MEKIDEFKDEYFFLSNYYECPVVGPIGTFGSSEAFYQSCKCANENDSYKFLSLNPDQAKKFGQQIEVRDDWEQIKEFIMYDAVLCKFLQNPDLRDKLIKTYPAELVEGNDWGDTYWGVDLTKPDKPGENMLGKVLMRVRDKFVKVNDQ